MSLKTIYKKLKTPIKWILVLLMIAGMAILPALTVILPFITGK